jgi:hypothetical protein
LLKNIPPPTPPRRRWVFDAFVAVLKEEKKDTFAFSL